VPGLTSKRVLTMEYMDGVSVNDVQGLADMGADLSEVYYSAACQQCRQDVECSFDATHKLCLLHCCSVCSSFRCGSQPVSPALLQYLQTACETAMAGGCECFLPQVSHLISEAFAEMVFTFGDVHCDPHAGEGCV
jgi:ABC1 atypical kinase-like domain